VAPGAPPREPRSRGVPPGAPRSRGAPPRGHRLGAVSDPIPAGARAVVTLPLAPLQGTCNSVVGSPLARCTSAHRTPVPSRQRSTWPKGQPPRTTSPRSVTRCSSRRWAQARRRRTPSRRERRGPHDCRRRGAAASAAQHRTMDDRHMPHEVSRPVPGAAASYPVGRNRSTAFPPPRVPRRSVSLSRPHLPPPTRSSSFPSVSARIPDTRAGSDGVSHGGSL